MNVGLLPFFLLGKTIKNVNISFDENNDRVGFTLEAQKEQSFNYVQGQLPISQYQKITKEETLEIRKTLLLNWKQKKQQRRDGMSRLPSSRNVQRRAEGDTICVGSKAQNILNLSSLKSGIVQKKN